MWTTGERQLSEFCFAHFFSPKYVVGARRTKARNSSLYPPQARAPLWTTCISRTCLIGNAGAGPFIGPP